MVAALPKYDLHTHSTASDGTLPPEELLSRAAERGVELLSLTDHDTVAGIDLLKGHPLLDTVRLMSGVELTASWSGRMVHIVGLNIDTQSAQLRRYLEGLERLRNERAEKICQRLVKAGVPDNELLARAKKIAGGGSIGRPHFAQVLVEAGVVNNAQAAFKNYLGAGKTGDVKMQWPTFNEAIDVIRRAGGEAVLAHPTKYKMTFTKIRTLVTDFVQAGGAAIEVSYTGITPNHQADLERLAAQKEILVSAGSDFHSPGQSWTDVGKFPAVKDPERHILTQLL